MILGIYSSGGAGSERSRGFIRPVEGSSIY